MNIRFMKKLLIMLFLGLFSTDCLAASCEKIVFWEKQRKGANCFNARMEEDWFRAADEMGIEWIRLTFTKWKGAKRDFLMGDAGNYQGIVRQDLVRLMQVLDWAARYDLKIVITPLGLPGSRWSQHNEDQRDLRLWNDKEYWRQAADFWRDLAGHLRNHKAVYGYNILNEPTPEMKTGLAEHGASGRYAEWYKKYKGSSHDLPEFYNTVIRAIRKVDPDTPIMVDGGWYAQPDGFVHWPRLGDDKVLYSFHMYEPYSFTSRNNFNEKHFYPYPGKVPFADKEVEWDHQQIETYFAGIFFWAKENGIPANRLVCGEFGCYRRNVGAVEYLTDVIATLNARKVHWAFYSFREDEWDGYDYEVGTDGLGWKYWQAKEAGEDPEVLRKDNPLFAVIKKEFAGNRAGQ
jgi:aryl-phospho-beta-D-glucosidase BglC (GH1 family)